MFSNSSDKENQNDYNTNASVAEALLKEKAK